MGGASHRRFYCSYCSPPPGVATRYRDTFKTEYVYAIVTRPVYVTCDPAHLLKTAIGGTGENRITYLRGATDLCEIFSNNSLVLSFHLSDYVVATKFTKIYFTNSLANERSCVMVCASLKV